MVMKGGCLCGKISYRISGNIVGINYCHCKQCQKASGSAFATSAAVNIDEFKITTGKNYLKAYQSSEGKDRYFCSHCGSPIYSHRRHANTVYIRLGTLDDDPVKRPEVHIFTTEKAGWHKITDNITQLNEDEELWF